MNIRTALKNIVFGSAIGLTYADVIGYIAKVEGASMQPCLNPYYGENDYIYLSRWKIRNFDVDRGDIVALVNPKNPEISILKRVVAFEGDLVRSYQHKKGSVRIPKGHCWIEGDHLDRSYDSNEFGPIPIGLIFAKATSVVWPPNRWQSLESRLSKEQLERVSVS